VRFTILTLFPSMFDGPLSESILGRARAAGHLEFEIVNPRDFAEGRHRVVDDVPFGGGAGMVMKPEPLVAAIEHARGAFTPDRVVMLTPQGRPFDQAVAKELATCAGGLALVCGRYEGFDERVREFVDDEICVGDYVLSGGEPAAWVVVDAVARLLPGVLGNERSAETESFEGGLLEGPQYTRPRDFRGRAVPEVLLSGDHGRIALWRQAQARARTRERRPDLTPGPPTRKKDGRRAKAGGDGDDR
jgi:tRNA (guanine37-N1)-methyltransferase